ncbi:hypothetical protein R3P38DRAFT_3348861 [Favolaschia claudopus]|uniref:Uncharacterized protein n=1 Tax=Favolaschia claudopus TaxID=2862362 RepID=A0AAW0CND6_9AGAR
MNAANLLRTSTNAARASFGLVDLADEDAASARLARHTLLQGASTVDELISMIPDDYRGVLTEPLKAIGRTAEKLASTRATLLKWEQHRAAGTFPSFVRNSAPQIQFTKDYGSSQAAIDASSALMKLHHDYMHQALSSGIDAKTAEVTALEQSISPQALLNTLSPLITTHYQSIKERSKLPKFIEGGEPGEVQFDGWIDNVAAKIVGLNVYEDCVVYGFRVVSITEAQIAKVELKFHKKKVLHQSADVEMADATQPGPSIQSLVDKAVSDRFKPWERKARAKYGKPDGKKTSSPKPAKPSNTGPRTQQRSKPNPKGKNAKAGGNPQKGKGKARK